MKLKNILIAAIFGSAMSGFCEQLEEESNEELDQSQPLNDEVPLTNEDFYAGMGGGGGGGSGFSPGRGGFGPGRGGFGPGRGFGPGPILPNLIDARNNPPSSEDEDIAQAQDRFQRLPNAANPNNAKPGGFLNWLYNLWSGGGAPSTPQGGGSPQ